MLILLKQGQKLVLSDALAVQSQGPTVSSLEVVLGSQNVLKKVVDIVDTVDIIESVHAVVLVDVVDIVDIVVCHC